MPLAEVSDVDNEKGSATLRLQDTNVCDDCETLACGLQGRNEVKVPLREQLELKPGDTVVVEENDTSLWAAGSLLFVLPLFLFITGTSIGFYIADYFNWPAVEIISATGGIFLILIALPFIRRAGNFIATGQEPYTVKAIHTPADSCPDS